MDFTNREKELLLSNAPVLSRITLYGENGEVLQVFNENDYLVDWDYEDFRYVPDQGFIGQFVERLLDGHLMNIPEGISLEDKEISVEIAVVDSTLQNQVYHNYGRFIITKVEQEDTTGSYKFESSDYTKKFNVAFKGDEVTYPCTALELLNHACEQAGVKLNSGKNLFDKNNANTFRGYITAAGVIGGSSSTVDRWLYIPCKPNTTYTITKPLQSPTANNRFKIGTSSDIPTYDTTLSDFWRMSDGGTTTTHTLTTGANANYLVMHYGNKTNSYILDIPEVLGGLQIEESPMSTTFEQHSTYAYCYCIPEDGLIAGEYYFKEDDTYYNFTISENLNLLDSLMLVDNKIIQRKINQDYEVVETGILYITSTSGTGTELEYNKVLYVDFINNNFVIENNQFEEQDSCRSVITSIAKLSYTWARINEDNVLKLDFAKKVEGDIDSYNEIDTDKYYEATTTGDSVQPVNKVLIGMSNVEGENIVNEVTSDDINLGTMEGDIYQRTYNGNQLIDLNNLTNRNTTSTFSNDTLTVTSTSGTYNNSQQPILNIIKNNPNKVLKFAYESVDLSSHTSSNNIIIQLELTIDGTNSWFTLGSKSSNTSLTLSNYTIPSDTSAFTRANIRIMTNNSSTDNTDSKIIITKPLIYLDSNNEYEPFVGRIPSPNLKYPQNINMVTGRNIIKMENKNLYNINDKKANWNSDFTIDENDWITLNSTNTSSSVVYRTFYTNVSKLLKPNTDYWCVIEIKGDKSYTGTASTIEFVSGVTSSYIGQFSNTSSVVISDSSLVDGAILKQKITTRSDFEDCYSMTRSIASVRANSSCKLTFRMSIVENEPNINDFVYEPYKYQEYEIDLGKNLLDIDEIMPQMINSMGYSSGTLVYDSSTKVLTMTNANTDTYLPAIYNNADNIPSANIKVDKNTYYTLHFEVDQPSSTWKNCVMGLDKSTNKYKYITNLTTVNTITFNTGDYDTIIFRIGSTAATGTITHFSNFQLERGSVVTNYAPYFSLSKNILEGVIESGGYSTTTGNKVVDNTLIRSSLPTMIEPNTKYIFSSNAQGSAVNVCEYDENMNYIGRITGAAIASGTSFTTSSNGKYVTFFRNASSGNINWQLEKGIIITPYVPHDKRIELAKINDYEDCITQNTGKNLLPYPYTQNSITNNGITFSVQDDGSVLVNGTATAQASFKLYGDWQVANNLPIPGQYLTGGSSDVILRAYHFSGSSYTNLGEDTGNGVIINSSVHKTCYIELIVANGTTVANKRVYPMCVNSLDDREYEPYGKGDWYIKESVDKVIFDGTELNLGKSGNANNISYYYSPNLQAQTSKIRDIDTTIMGTTSQSSIYPAYYNYFTAIQGNKIFTDITGAIFNMSSNKPELRCGFGLDSEINTIELFKAWLNEHNLKVCFPLQKPRYCRITYQPLINQLNEINEQAKTYEGKTYITSEGVEIDAPLQITVTDIDGVGTSYNGTDMTITNGHEYEPSTIAIYDNPLTHSETLRRIAINGSEKLFGLRYTPMEVNSIGHPWLKGNEFMKVTNLEEQDLYFYPFDRKMTYKGYLETTLSAQSKNEVAQKYENKNTIIDRVHHTEIDVDKANGQISLISTQTDENTSDISNLIVTTTGISTSVETIQNTTIPTINSNIDNISGDIDTINNQINTIQNTELTNIVSRLSQVEQTAESITNMFQISGGINIIRNSAFLLSDNLWEFTDSGTNPYHTSLGSSYNSTLSGTTTSVAEIKLRSIKVKSKSENITNLKSGTKYTFNFYHQQDNNMTTTIKMYSTENNSSKAFDDIEITGQQPFKNYEVSFTPTTYSNYTLEIIVASTASVGYSYLYDMMLNAGDKQSWQPASDEIYSTTLTMSRLGLQVYSVGDGTITLLGSEGLLSYETSDGRTRGRLISKRTVDGDLVVSTTAQNLYLAQDISQVAQNPSTTPKWVTTVAMVGGRLSEVKYLESGGQ